MVIFLIFLAAMFLLFVALFVYLLITAPLGYEDESGFHYVHKKGRKNQFNQPF